MKITDLRARLTTFAGLGRAAAVLLSVVALNLTLASGVQAQSFFSTIVVDPVAGVDRGSASQIQELDERTLYLSFDTYGADDIGPAIAGLGYVLPDALATGDQLDLVGILGGLSDDGARELIAGGIGYRYPLGGGTTTAFVTADHGDAILGTASNLAIDARATRTNLSFGLRRTVALEDAAKLVTTLEFGARHSDGEFLGTPVVQEDLRLLRASVLYEQGVPLLFQRRFAVAVTKGFDSLGASAASNPLASVPGASSDFLRVSFSAEASVPLSRKLVVNAGVIGQWSDSHLPLSQRCGYGTNAYARGFDQTYVSADMCFGGRAELAYNVELPDPAASRIVFTQAYAGIDAGWTRNNASALTPATRDTWSSGSIGVRSLRGDVIGEISVTRIFDQPAGFAPQDKTRLWVRVARKF